MPWVAAPGAGFILGRERAVEVVFVSRVEKGVRHRGLVGEGRLQVVALVAEIRVFLVRRLRALGEEAVGALHVVDDLRGRAGRAQFGQVRIAQVVGLACALHVTNQAGAGNALAGSFGHLYDGEREAVAHLQEGCRGDAPIGEFPEDFRIHLGRIDRGAAGEGEEGKKEGGLHHGRHGVRRRQQRQTENNDLTGGEARRVGAAGPARRPVGTSCGNLLANAGQGR